MQYIANMNFHVDQQLWLVPTNALISVWIVQMAYTLSPMCKGEICSQGTYARGCLDLDVKEVGPPSKTLIS